MGSCSALHLAVLHYIVLTHMETEDEGKKRTRAKEDGSFRTCGRGFLAMARARGGGDENGGTKNTQGVFG